MAIDAKKHLAYWREGAKEDMEVAELLLAKGKYRQALFFAHLVLEKTLKALIVKATNDVPPYVHNLTRLVQLCPISIPQDTAEFLALMNTYQIQGRYFISSESPMPKDDAEKHFARTRGVYEWLTKQL